MDNVTAEIISKKARALKHCNKVLEAIEKKGSAVITLNCTGVVFTVQKNDAIYLQLQATRAQLIQDIGSYEIVQKATKQKTFTRTAPAPIGSSVALSDEEMAALAEKRERNRKAWHKWYQANKEKKAEYNRQYKRRKKDLTE